MLPTRTNEGGTSILLYYRCLSETSDFNASDDDEVVIQVVWLFDLPSPLNLSPASHKTFLRLDYTPEN